MQPDLAAIAGHFQFEGRFVDSFPHPAGGHINDTYVVCYQIGDAVRRYILQRINHRVFTRPEQVMQNIEAVTAHLRRKIAAYGGDPARETLTLVPAVGGGTLHQAADGGCWRAYHGIENARTYNVAESLDQVYQAARAFGNFVSLLGDFPAEQLHETIPDFHHTPKRFEALKEAISRDVVSRAGAVAAEIDFAMQRAEKATTLIDLLERGELPIRITHNDTKLNNVMIDDLTGVGICVIDLDTVMPGLSLYDFGDAIRSGANPAAEDEQDLSRVVFDLAVFDRYTHGYLDATRGLLTPTELDYLPFSAILMTFECGIRFLADHLQGDTYFKIHREGHNLDRCRTQFKLVADMEAAYEGMVAIVDAYR
jgi:Ser/Thr protein kinase RdoA (MazF antagonist)